jgi:hypothetical protein
MIQMEEKVGLPTTKKKEQVNIIETRSDTDQYVATVLGNKVNRWRMGRPELKVGRMLPVVVVRRAAKQM